MVALGAKKDGLIAHDANYVGEFFNAVVTMYPTTVRLISLVGACRMLLYHSIKPLLLDNSLCKYVT